MSPEPFMSVDWNPWLRCALLFLGTFYLPGAAWGWVSRAASTPGPRAQRLLQQTVFCVVFSLLAGLLGALLLAAFGSFTPRRHFGLLLAVMVAGMWLGIFRHPARHSAAARWALPGAFLVGAAAVAIMWLPHRGEWIVGGWDPGTYVNQAVALSRGGHLLPRPDGLFASLSGAELEVFTRHSFNYLEAFPVVPIDPETRALQPFFFPLTPIFGAVLDRCGGLRAVTRLSDFAGLLGLVIFAGAAARRLRPARVAGAAILLLATQPIWIYHLHIPTSEVLQFALLAALAWLQADGDRSPWVDHVAVPALLFVATVNRFSFLPFGALWLGACAWEDLRGRHGKLNAQSFMIQALALMGGGLVDAWTNPVTLGRLGGIVPVLAGLAALGMAGALLLRAVGLDSGRARLLGGLLDRWALPALLAVAALLAAIPWIWSGTPLGELRSNLQVLIPYAGGLLVGAALAGAVMLCLDRSEAARGLRPWATFLLASAFVSLLSGQIARLMPWALRRHVEFTVPVLALLAAYALGRAVNAFPRTWQRRWLVPALAFVVALPNAGRAVRAWRTTDYDGLSVRLAAAAERLEPGDIVVADHFLFGVPLHFLYGGNVLNGELFLDKDEAPRMRAALKVLRRYQDAGYRIRFLTSTSRGLGVFPVEVGATTRDWSSGEFPANIVRHAKTASDFVTRPGTRLLQLWTWLPPDR